MTAFSEDVTSRKPFFESENISYLSRKEYNTFLLDYRFLFILKQVGKCSVSTIQLKMFEIGSDLCLNISLLWLPFQGALLIYFVPFML